MPQRHGVAARGPTVLPRAQVGWQPGLRRRSQTAECCAPSPRPDASRRVLTHTTQTVPATRATVRPQHPEATTAQTSAKEDCGSQVTTTPQPARSQCLVRKDTRGCADGAECRTG